MAATVAGLTSPPVIAGLSAVADRYDGFLLDLWGCIHNGVRPFPGVLDALARLRAAGKRMLVLSNAPRRADAVAASMARLGVDPGLVDGVLCSGEATWQALRERHESGADPWHARLGRRALHIGPDRDLSLFEGNGLERVTDVAAGDFALVTGPTEDLWPLTAHEDVLQACRARNLPMLCANPDLDVIRGETRLICAGAIARRYAELGGDVRQHGKPHADIYGRALALLGVRDRARVLAVGDSLRTDVAGARGAGIDVAFIPGGIHADELGFRPGAEPDTAAVAALAAKHAARPTWLLPELRW
jgi:HAD superfamily hydrolase (TIGR01459 family)